MNEAINRLEKIFKTLIASGDLTISVENSKSEISPFELVIQVADPFLFSVLERTIVREGMFGLTIIVSNEGPWNTTIKTATAPKEWISKSMGAFVKYKGHKQLIIDNINVTPVNSRLELRCPNGRMASTPIEIEISSPPHL